MDLTDLEIMEEIMEIKDVIGLVIYVRRLSSLKTIYLSIKNRVIIGKIEDLEAIRIIIMGLQNKIITKEISTIWAFKISKSHRSKTKITTFLVPTITEINNTSLRDLLRVKLIFTNK